MLFLIMIFFSCGFELQVSLHNLIYDTVLENATYIHVYAIKIEEMKLHLTNAP